MGRDIKFRAWNHMAERMQSWESLKEHGDFYRLLSMPNEYPLMQYTGLKDANGVEIYEGDIVEYFEVSPNSGGYGKTKRAVVKAEVSEFSFLFSVYHGSKVIGNIHQSPELLNDK